MREEFVMNLSLKTDSAATNRKLKDYQLANGIIVDKDLQDTPDQKLKPPRLSFTQSVDRSGLIHGLKKIEAPKEAPKYDPFQGMPIKTDYFSTEDDYKTSYNEFKNDKAMAAGGYDFREALEESLVRAFAGFGVFVEQEKTNAPSSRPTAATTASNDVF
jgi:hypothetical protein